METTAVARCPLLAPVGVANNNNKWRAHVSRLFLSNLLFTISIWRWAELSWAVAFSIVIKNGRREDWGGGGGDNKVYTTAVRGGVLLKYLCNVQCA